LGTFVFDRNTENEKSNENFSANEKRPVFRPSLIAMNGRKQWNDTAKKKSHGTWKDADMLNYKYFYQQQRQNNILQ
jgi:hypothetical protein